jgi:hypothetical protein
MAWLSFALLLGIVWGVCVAVFIELTSLGRWMTMYMTWFVVSVGMGGDLLIVLLLMDETGRVAWWQMVAVIAVSSVALVVRGLMQFRGYFERLMGGIKDANRQQNDVGA